MKNTYKYLSGALFTIALLLSSDVLATHNSEQAIVLSSEHSTPNCQIEDNNCKGICADSDLRGERLAGCFNQCEVKQAQCCNNQCMLKCPEKSWFFGLYQFEDTECKSLCNQHCMGG